MEQADFRSPEAVAVGQQEQGPVAFAGDDLQQAAELVLGEKFYGLRPETPDDVRGAREWIYCSKELLWAVYRNREI